MQIIDFGELIKSRRQELGNSRNSIALEVGCSSEFIREIEKGNRKPSQQTARRILETLKIEYSIIDPLTLDIGDNRRLQFRYVTSGRGMARFKVVSSLPKDDKYAALELRVAELEQIVAELRAIFEK